MNPNTSFVRLVQHTANLGLPGFNRVRRKRPTFNKWEFNILRNDN